MKKLILIAFVFGLVFSSCHREGQTGEITVVAFPKHHEKAIKGATVYVRFGATDLPGTSPGDFDLTIPGEADEDHVHIEKLRKGDYFLYAVGYDSTISQVVSGGIHIKLKGKTGEEEIDVPVTE